MENAVSVYSNDGTDEFPVLKAFQQYIDAEQAKSRKRIMMLCVFFSFVLTVVIGVFVVLLLGASSRNQTLNDRLVEYAMKDRVRTSVVVEPQPPKQDGLEALQKLTSRIEALSTALAEDRKNLEKAAEESSKRVTEKKQPSVEALEIERLKALLAAEKEKAAAERERLRQVELEEYRRKHYPELYGQRPAPSPVNESRKSMQRESEEADREIEAILKEMKAIDYFDEEDDEEFNERPRTKTSTKKKPSVQKPALKEEAASGIKDSAGGNWGIPLD